MSVPEPEDGRLLGHAPLDEYRIDDLARAAGMTVRNVRVYQDRGLLPPPRRSGRIGWYSQAHLTRLRFIGRLLERGYALAQIRELLDGLEQGKDLAEVLGLEQAIVEPWSDEQPQRVTVGELRRMFGKQATPGAITRGVELGLLRREGTRLLAPSPQLLRAGADLVAVGIPLVRVLDIAEAVQQDLSRVAERFVTVVLEQALGQRQPVPLTAEQLAGVAELIGRLRPHARRAVEALFAQAMQGEMDRALSEFAPHQGG